MSLLSAFGGFVSALMFLICFCFVLLCRYARIGYLFSRKDKKRRQEKKPEPHTAEPVYFLVERKKKAPKKNYEPPKKIEFR